jgi:4a-hydroxytetrahydrobiopterin dehydratase
MSALIDLCTRKCAPGSSNLPLSQDEIKALLVQLDGWAQYDRLIGKTFSFKNHYETLAFVNALAWVSHREDHHPELSVGYNKCHVEYTTHSIKGLSMNDFICAAKVDALFRI